MRLIPSTRRSTLPASIAPRTLVTFSAVTGPCHFNKAEFPPKVVYSLEPSEAKPLRALTKGMCDWGTYWATRTGATIVQPHRQPDVAPGRCRAFTVLGVAPRGGPRSARRPQSIGLARVQPAAVDV